MKTKIFFCFILLAAVSVFSLDVGDPALPFVNPNLDRQHVWSKNFIGKHWLILDFFATDCEACKEELPVLQDLLAEYEKLELKVLVFATDAEGTDIVGPYFMQNPTTLTVLLDRYRVAVKKYQVEEIPTLFVVNPEGVIVLKEVGLREDLFEQISSILNGE